MYGHRRAETARHGHLANPLTKLELMLEIETRVRFVEEEYRRLPRKGLRDENELGLAAAQLRDVPPAQAGKAEVIEK